MILVDQDEADSVTVRSRPISNQQPDPSSLRANPSESRLLPAWDTPPIGSLSSLASHMPVSSTGVEKPSTRRPKSTRTNVSSAQHAAHAERSPTLCERFQEVMPGIGSHFEDELAGFNSLPGTERSFGRHRILQWQLDVESRHLPLSALESRRHTDPAAYPAQSPSGKYSFKRPGKNSFMRG